MHTPSLRNFFFFFFSHFIITIAMLPVASVCLSFGSDFRFKFWASFKSLQASEAFRFVVIIINITEHSIQATLTFILWALSISYLWSWQYESDWITRSFCELLPPIRHQCQMSVTLLKNLPLYTRHLPHLPIGYLPHMYYKTSVLFK